jgi:hypothetical protein
VAVLAASAVSAWLTPGCRSGSEPRTEPPDESALRVYVVGSMAGALEPCGCVKDMLGGVDHAAAFLRGDAASRSQSLIVGAGPMLFLNRTLPAVGAEQHRFKAQAIAESFRDLGLSAWAPGANDWAAGPAELQRLERVSGATLLGGSRPVRVVDVKGQRVGLAGVTRSEPGRNPAAEDPAVALSRAKAELSRAGARILIALVALPRGDALRAIERAPGFDLAVIGKAHDEGEANDAAIPPVMIGETLVVQPPNHLQALSVVDFHVRGDSYDFKDGFGIQEGERRSRLSQRIRELEQRLLEWEKPDSGAGAPDVAARRNELSQMKQELAGIIGPPSRPDGSFFSYQLVEIREGLGSDPQVHARMNDYYRRVNEHNREAFKDRVPPPVSEGESSYVGGAACAACHEEEDKFWHTTPHASAYETLAKDHKEFNLECVGCHVTGYERPGGSTVTHVSRLKDVGCEVCHGPGSRHAAEPARRDRIVRSPPRSLCASECHHPPHVKEDWSVERAWAGILGPGHGAP